MALPDLHPSPAERWRLRFWKTVKTGFLLLAQALIFFLVLAREPVLGAAFSILLCYGTWQAISRVVTGAGFSFSLALRIQKAEELRDVLFTCFFALNTVVFVYHLLTWYHYYKPGGGA